MPETNIFTTVTVDADFISDTESDYGLLITPIASVDNPGYVSGASEGLPVTKYIKTESKIITPSDEMQEILPSAGKLLSKVIVRAADNVRPTLYAPSISLSGSILTITDNTSNGGFVSGYDIYATKNGVEHLIIEGATSTSINIASALSDAGLTEPGMYQISVKAKGTNFNDSVTSNKVVYTMSSFNINNKLNGTILNTYYNFEYYEMIYHQYSFSGGTPISVTLNGTTSNSYVEKTITTSGGYTAFVRAYVDGKITIYNDGANTEGITSYGELSCSITFISGASSDSDTFKARGMVDICLVAGTLIKTTTGYKKIEDIESGDMILTYDAINEAISETIVDEIEIRNGTSNIRKITLSNGAVIGATATHSFLTIDGWKCCEPNEYLEVQNVLNVGDKLKTFDDDLVEVVSIEIDTIIQPTYHIVLAEGNSFFITNDENISPIISEHYENTVYTIWLL